MPVNPGDVLQVTLKKHIEITETEHYWVAETADGQRFLIDYFQYAHYGFGVGQNIQVRVDKINCSGKVFIEPDHPVYERERIYMFPIDAVLSQSDNYISLIVRDVFDNKIPVQYHASGADDFPKEIELLVIGLRKGLPVLLDPLLKEQTPFKENEIYSFLVVDKIKMDQEEYFQLEDEFHRIHLLPARFYEKYPIEIGKPLECYIVSIEQNAELKLEPLHPVFHLGHELDLNFVGEYHGDEYIGQRHKLFLLRDDEGNDFFMSVRFMEGREIPKRLRCRIEKMKKGQPLVEPV